jgi:hypothetical protein
MSLLIPQEKFSSPDGALYSIKPTGLFFFWFFLLRLGVRAVSNSAYSGYPTGGDQVTIGGHQVEEDTQKIINDFIYQQLNQQNTC